MDTRTQMLKAAESILPASPDRDISTRAVCDAVGVGGSGALPGCSETRTACWPRSSTTCSTGILARKRAIPLSDDPVDDLYTAWDTHVAFALKNPAVFRIAYAPSLAEVPGGVEESRQLLVKRFIRCAEAGRLNTTPDQAAQSFMAACLGVEMGLLAQPATFDDPDLSRRVRDAVVRDLIVDPVARVRISRPTG